MNTIDLHIHTNFSDGKFTPETVLQKAEEAGVKVISITDHDDVRFYTEWLKANDVKKYFRGRIIPGIEITTILNGAMIEFLGYNINTDIIEKELKKKHVRYSDLQKKQVLKILETFCRNGFELNADDFTEKEINSGRTTMILNKILKSEKFNNHPKRKFIEDNWKMFLRNHLTNPDSDYFTDFSDLFLTPKEVCRIIKKAGGQVIMAHPGIYINYIDIFNYVIKNLKIDGIECFHHQLTDEQQEFFANFAKANGYLISGGSDYHRDERSLIGSINFDARLAEGVLKEKIEC